MAILASSMKAFFNISLLAYFLFWLAGCSGSKTSPEERLIAELATFRVEKDIYFQSSPESPFKDLEFKGLNYYPPNSDLRIIADVIEIPGNETLTLATSDSKERKYTKYGYAEFEIHKIPVRVLLLESEEESTDELMLIFADGTSAEETYGAGRYLELVRPKDGKISIDFNYSYNPYCAYNAKYSCPFPPLENQLTVPIRAGERNYTEN